MKPTLGRIIRFVEPTGIERAAIVTLVHEDGTINVTVFRANGDTYGASKIPEDANIKPRGNSWHWPPRE